MYVDLYVRIVAMVHHITWPKSLWFALLSYAVVFTLGIIDNVGKWYEQNYYY